MTTHLRQECRTPERRRFWSAAAALVLAPGLLAGCSSLGGSSVLSDASDRFSQLFGSRSQEAGTPTTQQQAEEPDCPGVDIRAGASTLAVTTAARAGASGDLRYQGTIGRTARECAISGGNVLAKVGIAGRIIVGPGGAPSSVDVPLRIAVVQEGAHPKTIASKFYRTTVAMPAGENSVAFTFVAEDFSYPVPAANVADAYVFYVGFDPEGAKTAPRPKAARKR
ncbi:MAG: hypothetical protein EPO23_07650 [Xanthobacteraceae bacterium]|nr:MAG: hypothetical protein EPO23_07650 [Xanthobacteraceae bacterium]